jgi:uridylate kinase
VAESQYRRVVLKLSGEAFSEPTGSGIDAGVVARIAE